MERKREIDVNRSNDFKQMTSDHSDEWRRNTEKSREEKGFKKISTNGRNLTVYRTCVLLHVFTSLWCSYARNSRISMYLLCSGILPNQRSDSAADSSLLRALCIEIFIFWWMELENFESSHLYRGLKCFFIFALRYYPTMPTTERSHNNVEVVSNIAALFSQ